MALVHLAGALSHIHTYVSTPHLSAIHAPLQRLHGLIQPYVYGFAIMDLCPYVPYPSANHAPDIPICRSPPILCG
jgi:hypothetical protein